MSNQTMRSSKVVLSAVLASALLLSSAGVLKAAESQKLLKDTPFEEIVAKAKGGNGDAQYFLAKAHALPGNGVPYSPQESHKWYVAAATNNVREAQFYHGQHFYEDVKSTRGNAPKDKAKRQQSAPVALSWLVKAAKQGSFSAWLLLGKAFDEGTVFAKDPVEAYKWYHLAVEKGDNNIFAPVTQRNAFSLKLTPAQIELAKRRAVDFWEAQGEEKKPTAPK